MSTDEAEERLLSFSRRRRTLILPAEPSDEELARDWTLSAEDLGLIGRCRDRELALWVALELCAFRRYTRFFEVDGTWPLRLVNHVAGQLALPPTLLVRAPEREATGLEYQQRIREHLGYQPFDEEVRTRLEAWLVTEAERGLLPVDLLDRTESILRVWNVQLPAASTLERMVASAAVRARQGSFEKVAARLTPECTRALDGLLEVAEGSHRSRLFSLKEYPPDPSPLSILSYIERYRLLESLGVETIDLADLSPAQRAHWMQLVKRYEADDLRRFAPAKRHALLACFLVETRMTVLDHLVAMNDRYLLDVHRRAKRCSEEEYREIRKRSRQSLETLLDAVEILLDRRRPIEEVIAEFLATVDHEGLRAAFEACREVQQVEEKGLLSHLRSRHSHLKRYLPRFLGLPFQGEAGSEPLLRAVEMARQLESGSIQKLPEDAPIDFVPERWRSAIEPEPGKKDRSLWEMALALALRDALRSGDLYLPGSRRHVAFSGLLYDTTRWRQERDEAYAQLRLSMDARHPLADLRQTLEEAARSATE